MVITHILLSDWTIRIGKCLWYISMCIAKILIIKLLKVPNPSNDG